MERDEQNALSSTGPAGPRPIDAATMMACGSCGRVIQVGDAFCRHCGKALTRKKKAAWYYEPAWILVLGLLVIGPLALPLVIRSPKLSRNAKWGFSIVLAVYGIVITYYLYVTCIMLWNLYAQTADQLRGM